MEIPPKLPFPGGMKVSILKAVEHAGLFLNIMILDALEQVNAIGIVIGGGREHENYSTRSFSRL